jgi:hypothetical protein
MSTERELRRAAQEAAEYAQTFASQLEQEVSDLEMRLAQKKAERDAARLAPKRLADFQVKIGADYQCPHCWMENGIHSPLHGIPGSAREDVFRCRTCGNTFSVSF